MTRTGTILATLALAASSALAAQPGRTFDPAARAAAIAPFIDEQTLAVGHVDIKRIHLDAIFAKITEIGKFTDEYDHKQVAKMKASMHRWMSDFLKAGGRDIYMILSLADLPRKPICVVVPLRAGADRRAIRALLYSGKADGPTAETDRRRPGWPGEKDHVVRNAVVLCRPSTVERLRAMKPAPRPYLVKAFAAAGNTAAQFLILPTADNRRVVEAMMPQLPQQIGGGPSTAVTRGVLWAAVGADGPPGMSLQVLIQSQDAPSAQALSGAIARSWKALRAIRPLREAVPEIDKITAMLTPKVAQDSLTLRLAQEQADLLLSRIIGPALLRARGQARQTISMSNLREIGKGIVIYAAGHKDAYPASLEALLKEGVIPEQLLISPLSDKKAYVYVRPPAPRSRRGERGNRVMAYEDPSTHGRKKTAVLFVDTHVQLMRVNERFWNLVKEAKAASEKAYGKGATRPR